ncbi:hypothetical protein [Streptomyces sp. MST-110588]|uniref:hypothetical protein n=1 Tax=Streptomyces sp. MST-110588 TaxID=2833628 RepID=UPI001F5D97AB|nr:hypothetical protein [Streptomyces sp. MST-110588]UNO42376.1 hypothetical protein KGS77_26185 [Streptomyces sp. MST-110588]
MKYSVWQVVGMALTVLGAQGAIRLLFDHGNYGLLGWAPGGFGAHLTGHLAAVGIGIALAGWADSRRKRLAKQS